LPSIGGTAVDARRSLSRWPASAHREPGPLFAGGPPGSVSAETMGSPRFLGNPQCVLAVLSDPGRAQCARPLQRLGAANARLEHAGLINAVLSRLNRTAFTLAVYAS